MSTYSATNPVVACFSMSFMFMSSENILILIMFISLSVKISYFLNGLGDQTSQNAVKYLEPIVTPSNECSTVIQDNTKVSILHL